MPVKHELMLMPGQNRDVLARLGFKALALAWPGAALACSTHRPGPKPSTTAWPGLGCGFWQGFAAFGAGRI